MKKTILLSLPFLAVLTSCNMNSFGEKIQNESQFVEIANTSDTDFNVAKANLVTAKSDNAKDSSVIRKSAHNAELYSSGDFVCETDKKIQGFTIKYDVETYFLITGDKNGTISESSDFLTSYRNQTLSLINEDYSEVLVAYANMKKFAGKKSGEEVDGTVYSTIYLASSLAGDTLGYTMKIEYDVKGGKRFEQTYITLDKVKDKWGISFYSHRITDTLVSANGGTEESYYVVEYVFSCLTDEGLSQKNLAAKTNLKGYSFSVSEVTSAPTSSNGIPFSQK
ncbi:MAG TPA: hypothetical protein DD384_04795 [Firmicutes bacterium]|nr:hypothetical protein [Bacillota bacterium]